MSIDLAPALLRQVQAILAEHVPECEVWAFGSRIGGSAKRFSDLDLAIVAEQEIPTRRLALLANAFEESDLPFRVDLVDYHSANPTFKERIAQRRQVIFGRS